MLQSVSVGLPSQVAWDWCELLRTAWLQVPLLSFSGLAWCLVQLVSGPSFPSFHQHRRSRVHTHGNNM